MSPLGAALRAVDWHPRTKHRWLLAYWFFDSPGAACWLAQLADRDYAKALTHAARRKTPCPLGLPWPHRGGFSVKLAVQDLRDTLGDRPEDFVQIVRNAAPDYARMLELLSGYPDISEAHAREIIELANEVFDLRVPVHTPLPAMPIHALRALLAPWCEHATLARELMLMLTKEVS